MYLFRTFFLIFSFFLIQDALGQSNELDTNNNFSKKTDNTAKENTTNVVNELTSKEKYALKMLKQGYSITSIQLQTNIDKKRIKEIKKSYLKK
ncbi:MAG: hypothetical protein VX756_01375 [Bacteroidota bacterium]|nr:hypothetical protein [Bacteroidota bacterium]